MGQGLREERRDLNALGKNIWDLHSSLSSLQAAIFVSISRNRAEEGAHMIIHAWNKLEGQHEEVRDCEVKGKATAYFQAKSSGNCSLKQAMCFQIG